MDKFGSQAMGNEAGSVERNQTTLERFDIGVRA